MFEELEKEIHCIEPLYPYPSNRLEKTPELFTYRCFSARIVLCQAN